jgi:catechol 2,3-dioxygenase-like lactoylglutathione lyase family enzyme
MIDHVSISVRDLTESTFFYESVLSKIGFAKLVEKPGTIGFGKKYPEFWLNHRSQLERHVISDGFHVCLRARTADQVRDFHARAVVLGAQSDGEPGFRLEYSGSYYAAFIRDRDGNRIEVVTFVTDQE